MFSAALKSGAAAAPPDAQFNYVTMLLHGDGTNGAQNNTFLDSSTNNFSITRNGNTTQGSFSPYGSNWSNNFNGTTAYLQFANNTAFAFGSGDFTIEFWMNASTLETGTLQPIINKGTDYSSEYAPFDISRDGTDVQLWLGTAGPTWGIVGGASIGTIVIGQWSHFAVTRSGTTFKAFQNGVQTWTTTSSDALLVSTFPLRLAATSNAGSFFNGYLSNVRLVKGTAVYTSAFTPSTTPLTAISGTSVLTCQSNRFVDNSSNAFTATVVGAPTVQRFNPFGTATAYSTSVIGGSGYFDGTGDYLTIAGTSTACALPGDFTIECWYYQLATTNYGSIFSTTTTYSTANSLRISTGNATNTFQVASAGAGILNASTAFTPNSWINIVLVRSGTTITLYQNGVSVGTATNSQSFVSNTFIIGDVQGSGAPYCINGYISNFRVVKGTAVYTTAFTPTTTPVTAISGTSLLTNMTNGAIFDNAMMNNLETVGNAQISTSVKKYGTGSMYFDGTGDWLTSLDNPSHEFGSGNFTLECWINTTVSNSGYVSAVAKWSSSNQSWMIRAASTDIGSGWSFFYSTDGSNYYTVFGASINDGNWHHLAVTRSGNVFRTFTDGTLNNSRTDAVTLFDGTASLFVGAQGGGSNPFTGYIDDLRITKGYARYTASFTAPTAAFPNTGPY